MERIQISCCALVNLARVQKPITSDTRTEIHSIDRALEQLRSDEAAAIHAQIAGIRAGASPDAYASVLADIAVRRKDMKIDEARELSRHLSKPTADGIQKGGAAMPSLALADALVVLTSDLITGSEKHEAVMYIVQKVICKKDCADVIFTPGLFGENKPGNMNGGESIDYTTCIGINTQK